MTSDLDCGDHSCSFAKNKTGMRTNGGCRCLKALEPATEVRLRRYIHKLESFNKRAQEALQAVYPAVKRAMVEKVGDRYVNVVPPSASVRIKGVIRVIIDGLLLEGHDD